MDTLLLLLGLGVLVLGGEFLVRGAVGVARNLSISPLVIGMTVVSFGTSAPELLVSLQAATEGNPEIAVGNVVGSNIANLALVLGITVLIFPIFAERQTKVVDWPMMMLATVLFGAFALNGVFEAWEGAVLFAILIGFTTWLIRKSRKEGKLEVEDHVKKDSTVMSLLYLSLGLVGLYFGSEWFVGGAVGIAEYFGMSQTLIGVTIVAFGTSAPELVASCVAAYRKQTDISVGNLIGSNIFNIMAVIGITSMVTPIKVSNAILSFDMFWVFGVALLMIPVLYFGKKVGRLKGIVLLSTYLAYIGINIALAS